MHLGCDAVTKLQMYGIEINQQKTLISKI